MVQVIGFRLTSGFANVLSKGRVPAMDLHAPNNIVEFAAWIIVLAVAIPLAGVLSSITGGLIAALFEAEGYPPCIVEGQ